MSAGTLDALLVPAARLKRGTDTSYGFCAVPDCPIVYFSADGARQFTEADVIVPVWQKRPDQPDVPICYCFGHTRASLRGEWIANGMITAPPTVAAAVRNGACACEVRNPQGRCCLGNLTTVCDAIRQSAGSPPRR